MKRAEILDAVREVIRRDLSCEVPVAEESEMLGDLQLDSLQRLTLAVEIENRFEICFDPEQEQSLLTVGDVLDVIEHELGAGRRDDGEA